MHSPTKRVLKKYILNTLLTIIFCFNVSERNSFALISTITQIEDVNCGPLALMGICNEFKVVTSIQRLQELSWYDQVLLVVMLRDYLQG